MQTPNAIGRGIRLTNEELMQRGQDADRLLSDPLFTESVGKVREGLVSSMETSALGDKETHNRLVIALQLLGQIEKRIKEVAETGKLTAIQVENKRRFGLF